MKFIAIIPARYASTRFPGKPLALIEGRPMIEHVYKRTAEHFQVCCVATDDERIKEVVEGFGGRVVMTSAEHQSGTDRCAEALEKMEQELGEKFDVVVNVQGDEPFVSSDHLIKIKNAFSNPLTQIATIAKLFSEKESIENPNSPKVVISKDGFALYFSRSVIPYLRGVEPTEWSSTYPYLKHIGLYGYRAEVLREITKLEKSALEIAESLEQLRWLENGYRIKVEKTEVDAVSVDTPEDLERVKKIFKGEDLK